MSATVLPDVSPRRLSIKRPPTSSGETTVKSGKPCLKLARCIKGSLIIVTFAILPDIYLLYFNTIYTFAFSMFKNFDFSGSDRFFLPASFISFIASVFSMIFTIAILSVSSLTMKKQKKLKLAPYMAFALFKIILQFWRGSYSACAGFFIKDLLLYLCMSHTAKNQFVRKFFKPYKQVVTYGSINK